MKQKLSLFFIIMVLLAIIAISVVNRTSITLNYIFGKIHLPLFMLMIVLVLLGMLIQYFLSFFKIMSLNQEIKQLKHVLLADDKEKE